ncbi:MAG: alpha/beta hydrolase [Sphingobacteriales bacterium]|nr:alpha/beta hydrolase [Sphingobacteriales bacterium]
MNNSIDKSITKHYMEEGQGDVIILLYGLFGSVNNFRYLVDHLKKTHRVIVPKFPFYDLGYSVTVFSLTEFLQQLILELNLEKFHLLGNSMGGHIALLYTLQYPEKVKSLILSGSSGLYESGMGDSYPKRSSYDFIKNKTELTFYDPGIASKELVDEIYATVNSRKALHILSLAKSTIHNNLEKELTKIKTDCCLIWGQNDTITPPEVALKFNRLIPHSKLFWIERCGHVPMLETPQSFNVILDNFLDEYSNSKSEEISSSSHITVSKTINSPQIKSIFNPVRICRCGW